MIVAVISTTVELLALFSCMMCLLNFRVESFLAVEECNGVNQACGRPRNIVKLVHDCALMIRSIRVRVRLCQAEEFGRAYMYALE